jgi:hypothetical protein
MDGSRVPSYLSIRQSRLQYATEKNRGTVANVEHQPIEMQRGEGLSAGGDEGVQPAAAWRRIYTSPKGLQSCFNRLLLPSLKLPCAS